MLRHNKQTFFLGKKKLAFYAKACALQNCNHNIRIKKSDSTLKTNKQILAYIYG